MASVSPDYAYVNSWLLVGNLKSCLSVNTLLNEGVVNVVDMSGIDHAFSKNLNYLVVDIRDKPFANILACIDTIFSFVESAKSCGQKTLINCAKGQSRSVSAVIGYLMKLERDPRADEVLKLIKTKRGEAQPLDSFMQELRSFGESDFNAGDAWTNLSLSIISRLVETKNAVGKIFPNALVPDPTTVRFPRMKLHISEAEERAKACGLTNVDIPRVEEYMCKRCRYVLFERHHILEKLNEGSSYRIVPLNWMSALHQKQCTEGHIPCPAFCGEHVATYSWIKQEADENTNTISDLRVVCRATLNYR